MTVLLMLLTFAFFLTLDLALQHRAARRPVPGAEAPRPAPVPVKAGPVWVAGYRMPEDLHYHPAHTWVRFPEAGPAVVGLDDFARQLVGGPGSWELPAVGARVRQGVPAFRARLDGKTAEFLSPVDGEVIAVNEGLEDRPELPDEDPYGRGWVFRVRPDDAASDARNLLSGTLAGRWMAEARVRLQWNLMALSGSVLQDGGEPAADFAHRLPEADWRRLIREFLLT